MANEQAKKITAKDVTTPELYAYLVKNGLCEKYMNNLLNENTHIVERIALIKREPYEPYGRISCSFTWCGTEEGHEFWRAHSNAFDGVKQPIRLDEQPINAEKQPAKKQYRITYRSEIYVDATDEQAAERIFEELGEEEMAAARFVEVVSVEEQE